MDISAIASAAGANTVSGASSGAPPRQKMSSLFDAIDTAGTGSITKAQFEQAFQTRTPPAVFQQQGADAIFAQLDSSGTGSVSKSDFVTTMSQLMSSLRAPAAGSSAVAPADTLGSSQQALDRLGAPGSLVNLSV